VEVSNNEDDVTKKSVGDDVGDGGASSAELITPNLIRSNASGQIDPSVADRPTSTDALVGGRRRKRPLLVPKQKQALPSADQVMIQIKLPPYRGPRSPLDLVVVEIIFGRIFEDFRHISQATGTGTSTGGVIQPQKKMCHPFLKKILVPRKRQTYLLVVVRLICMLIM
jgi:hypothetical protein